MQFELPNYFYRSRIWEYFTCQNIFFTILTTNKILAHNFIKLISPISNNIILSKLPERALVQSINNKKLRILFWQFLLHYFCFKFHTNYFQKSVNFKILSLIQLKWDCKDYNIIFTGKNHANNSFPSFIKNVSKNSRWNHRTF